MAETCAGNLAATRPRRADQRGQATGPHTAVRARPSARPPLASRCAHERYTLHCTRVLPGDVGSMHPRLLIVGPGRRFQTPEPMRRVIAATAMVVAVG